MSHTPVDTTLNLFSPPSHSDNPSSSRNKKHKKPKHNSPMFVSSDAQNRFVRNKLQPGKIVQLGRESELFGLFVHAKWNPMLVSPTRRVLPNMVAEFFCNMGVGSGVGGVSYLTSVINGKPILLDHVLLGKILKLDPKVLSLSPVDVTKTYTFNSDELRLFISVFCGVEVPSNVFNTDRGIDYEHFTPFYQTLAEIIRVNIFPSQTAGKLMSFVEMKIMYKLACKKIDFNLPYMIITKMISAARLGYMPYGLLLTQVFEHFSFDINFPPYFSVSHTISDRTHRATLPLPELNAMPAALNVQFGTLPPVSLAMPDVNAVVSALPAHDNVDTIMPVVSIANVLPVSTESVIGPSVVPSAVPISNAPHDQLSAYFSVLVKLSSKCDELDNDFKDLKNQFVSLSEKYTQLLERMDIVMTVLGSAMGRLSVLESNLSQLVQIQIDASTPPPKPVTQSVVIEDLDTEIVDVAVKSEVVVNGDGSVNVANDIDADMMNAVINSDSFNQVD